MNLIKNLLLAKKWSNLSQKLKYLSDKKDKEFRRFVQKSHFSLSLTLRHLISSS